MEITDLCSNDGVPSLQRCRNVVVLILLFQNADNTIIVKVCTHTNNLFRLRCVLVYTIIIVNVQISDKLKIEKTMLFLSGNRTRAVAYSVPNSAIYTHM